MKNIPFFKNLPGKGSFVHNNLIGVCMHFNTVDSKVLAALHVCIFIFVNFRQNLLSLLRPLFSCFRLVVVVGWQGNDL